MEEISDVQFWKAEQNSMPFADPPNTFHHPPRLVPWRQQVNFLKKWLRLQGH